MKSMVFNPASFFVFICFFSFDTQALVLSILSNWKKRAEHSGEVHRSSYGAMIAGNVRKLICCDKARTTFP